MGVSMGSPKFGGRWGHPLGCGVVDPLEICPFPPLLYFGRFRSKTYGDLPEKKLILRVPPFKVTQGH